MLDILEILYPNLWLIFSFLKETSFWRAEAANSEVVQFSNIFLNGSGYICPIWNFCLTQSYKDFSPIFSSSIFIFSALKFRFMIYLKFCVWDDSQKIFIYMQIARLLFFFFFCIRCLKECVFHHWIVSSSLKINWQWVWIYFWDLFCFIYIRVNILKSTSEFGLWSVFVNEVLLKHIAMSIHF